MTKELIEILITVIIILGLVMMLVNWSTRLDKTLDHEVQNCRMRSGVPVLNAERTRLVECKLAGER